MKKVVDYFVVDSNVENGEMCLLDPMDANNYLTGLRLGYLRAAQVLCNSVNGFTQEQKLAIYQAMDKAFSKAHIITLEREVE